MPFFEDVSLGHIERFLKFFQCELKGENRLSRPYFSFSVTLLEKELELMNRSKNFQAAVFSPGHEPA